MKAETEVEDDTVDEERKQIRRRRVPTPAREVTDAGNHGLEVCFGDCAWEVMRLGRTPFQVILSHGIISFNIQDSDKMIFYHN